MREVDMDCKNPKGDATLRVNWQCKKCGGLRTKLVRDPDWSLMYPKDCEVKMWPKDCEVTA